MMAYKLTYFNIPLRGQPAKLIFAAAGVKFNDIQTKFGDWPALKSTLEWGQLPLLEVGDKTLTQSKTIYRYLGHKFNLAGEDDWDSAKCDELVDHFGDIFEGYIEIAFKEKDPEKKAALKEAYCNGTLPAFLGKLDSMQGKKGGTFLVSEKMTWADIVIAEMLRQLCETSAGPELLDPYPHLRTMKEAVFANENIKQYLQSA